MCSDDKYSDHEPERHRHVRVVLPDIDDCSQGGRQSHVTWQRLGRCSWRHTLSRDSIHDQLVCRIWVTRLPLWSMLIASTYSTVIIAFERYFAVIHPIWYKVRLNSHFLLLKLKGLKWCVLLSLELNPKGQDSGASRLLFRVRHNSPPFPLPFTFSPPFHFPLPSLPSHYRSPSLYCGTLTLKSSYRVWGSVVSSPSGFGAQRARPSSLWCILR